MLRSIMLCILVTLMLSVNGCVKNEPKASSTSEVVWLEKGDVVPFSGYLFNKDDTVFLLKRAVKP